MSEPQNPQQPPAQPAASVTVNTQPVPNPTQTAWQGAQPQAPTQQGAITQPLDPATVDQRVDARLQAREREQQAAADARKAEQDRIAAEVERQVNERVQQREVADAKAALKTEYNLTDAQLTALQGDNAEALRSSAETLFAAQKPTPPPAPPNTPPGGTGGQGQRLDPSNPPSWNEIYGEPGPRS